VIAESVEGIAPGGGVRMLWYILTGAGLLLGGLGVTALIYYLTEKRTRCEAAVLHSAQNIEIRSYGLGWRCRVVNDAEILKKITNHFVDEPVEAEAEPAVFELYVNVPGKFTRYNLLVSHSGWRFSGEKGVCRKIRNTPEFFIYLESLLPEPKPGMLKAVPGLAQNLMSFNIYLSRKRCDVEALRGAESITLWSEIPVHRTAHVTDPEFVRKVTSFLLDEPADGMEGPGVCLLYFKVPATGKFYGIMVSHYGWNFFGENPSCREITDTYELLTLLESAMPDFTEEDLRSIPIPEEDLSWFDESKVPEDLRDLIPLAKKWGVGDDLYRGEIGRRATIEERKELVEKVKPRGDRIMEFVDEAGLRCEEAVRMMYMLTATSEVIIPDEDTEVPPALEEP
jgi:hypothetical protein